MQQGSMGFAEESDGGATGGGGWRALHLLCGNARWKARRWRDGRCQFVRWGGDHEWLVLIIEK